MSPILRHDASAGLLSLSHYPADKGAIIRTGSDRSHIVGLLFMDTLILMLVLLDYFRSSEDTVTETEVVSTNVIRCN